MHIHVMKASTEPRTWQSVFLCRVVTPDQTTPPANVWVQMQGTGRGTYAQEGKGQEQGGRKAWPTWSSQDISLLLTFGCLPRATGREVKLLLLRSHSPWWQQFDGPLWNSYPLVTSDTWHRCIYLWNPKPPHHPPPLSPVTCTLHPQSSSSLSSLSPGSICLLSFK